MLNFESIVPSLKRHESISSYYDKGNGYVRFTIVFSRYRWKRQSIDIYASAEGNTVSVRYYHGECEEWAHKALQAFLVRMKKQLAELPALRLRLATGAMRIEVQGFHDEDYEEDVTDVHDMLTLFLGLLLGIASIMEVFILLHVATIGFLALAGLSALFAFYTITPIFHDVRFEWKRLSSYLALGIALLTLSGISLLFGVFLCIGLVVAWLLPYPLTFLGFLCCLFGYRYVVEALRSVQRLNEKYASKV